MKLKRLAFLAAAAFLALALLIWNQAPLNRGLSPIEELSHFQDTDETASAADDLLVTAGGAPGVYRVNHAPQTAPTRYSPILYNDTIVGLWIRSSGAETAELPAAP
jgi:hypothetical protein